MRHSITWSERQKARQRLAGENGTIIKDWGGKLPFAFVYPNTYFIGMSNLGLQAIYGLLNHFENIVCERLFWDSENSENGLLPLSVESQRPLTDFAVLAFSLNYELDYLNLASLLKASHIPLYSEQRDASLPLLIAGGPCITANPLPVAPFFDCLCSGEAEALLPAMIPVLRENIAGDREDLLLLLSKLPGVYIPRRQSTDPIDRQWVRDLDKHPVHSVVLAQNTELHDLYLLEVQRGCAHGCRFCLVNSSFRPPRFHSLESLIEQAHTGLGFRKRIGLVGPAVTDHPQINELFTQLLEIGAQLAISSLRMTSLSPGLMAMMAQGGVRSIALAPESGSNCLRQSIRKGINEEQILEAIHLAVNAGMQQIKLYFMIGLPEETEKDIQAIVDLMVAVKLIVDRMRARTRLTVNLSPFVPKAGTAFQRIPMASLEALKIRAGFLGNNLGRLGIKVNRESPQWSEVQAVLARGDSSLAPVLAAIEKPSLPAWRNAAGLHRLDIDFFAHQKWNMRNALPWRQFSGNSPA